ncbi:hypothetical protein ACFTZJ_21960 [Streptomyces globisporus]|uniref:DUF6197 family protein n=1 Tax=Streptomyces globisporus TaxID=1908 RepID=UPI0036343472
MPKTTPTPGVVITRSTLHKAQELAALSYGSVWTGPSGEESSGEAVARHLEATAALLATNGWDRIWTPPTPAQLAEADAAATTETMLRQLLDYIREEERSASGRLTAGDALNRVARTADGDPDTGRIAGDVLDLVVVALTGHPSARFGYWSERLNRTFADITALLTAGALFARTYGPAPERAA